MTPDAARLKYLTDFLFERIKNAEGFDGDMFYLVDENIIGWIGNDDDHPEVVLIYLHAGELRTVEP